MFFQIWTSSLEVKFRTKISTLKFIEILLENFTKKILEIEFWQILQSALNRSNKTWLEIYTATKNEYEKNFLIISVLQFICPCYDLFYKICLLADKFLNVKF